MSFDFRLANGNIPISSTGDLDIVRNTDKLVQDVLKVAITPVGANKMHIWYGSNFGRTLIGSPLDIDFAKQISAGQLVSALENLKVLQTSQLTFQDVSASEMILKILKVDVRQNNQDPRLMNVIIGILSRAMVKSNVGFDVTI